MSSSFIYQPHIHQTEGTVITPDIAIDRVFATMTLDGLEAEPVSRLTSAAQIQQPAESPLGAPAVVLVAASFGMLVSVGMIGRDMLPLARAAWRYDDVRDGYGEIVLRFRTERGGARTEFASEKLSQLMPPAVAMKSLGNAAGLKPGTAVFIGHPAGLGESIDADRFEVALDAGERSLNYGADLELLR